MWIEFRSKQPYAIKIYVGGVNAISGTLIKESMATRLRRQNLMLQRTSVQDYIVVPEQRRLDGVATGNGQVRQFVAMKLGSHYSVEAQMTGQEVTGGLQFEITPSHHGLILLNIGSLGRSTDCIEYQVNMNETMKSLRRRIEEDSRLEFGSEDYMWYYSHSGLEVANYICVRGNAYIRVAKFQFIQTNRG